MWPFLEMNSTQQESWQFNAIKQVLVALAENEYLRKCLVFKGALILNQRISTLRKSLDIDSNLIEEFIEEHPRQEQQIILLKYHLERAISRHFERQDPVRFELKKIKIVPSPKTKHPLGWNAFVITISLLDHENLDIRGLPSLTIDVAAPERYSKHSFSELKVGQTKIIAYTLERIAGEKARAYLMSLPTYRDKVDKHEKAIRVKDLYDLALIVRKKTISNKAFWIAAGNEFKISSESRFVDCFGSTTFLENRHLAEELYRKSPTIPKDIPFEDVEKSVLEISNYWTKIGIIPFSYPLPTQFPFDKI